MTNGEASAINTLCRWLLGPDAYGRHANEDEARQALVLLVEKAYKHLSAGWSGRDVARRWGDPEHDVRARRRGELLALRGALEGIARAVGLPGDTPDVDVVAAVEQLAADLAAFRRARERGGLGAGGGS